MSIANGTTHYGYPQVQLTDRPTFADFNPAFADIDSKLYGLITGATTDEADIAQLKLDVSDNTTAIGQVRETANTANGKADANAENITLLQGQVGNVQRDVANKLYSVAIAEPYDADAGTYSIGDIVVYNGQRYKCTTAVAVAEPFDADKWTGEDVETVLEHLQDEIDNIPAGGGTAADITLAPITGMTADDVQEGIEELKGMIPDPTHNYILKNSSYVDITTYGSADSAYTCPSDGYINAAASNQNAIVYMVGDSGNNMTAVRPFPFISGGSVNTNGVASLFVKKGLKLFTSGSFVGAIFIPIE